MADGEGVSGLERLLQRDRAITAVGLAVLCALAWLYLLQGAGLGRSAWDMGGLALFPHKAASAAMAMPTITPGADMGGMAMPPVQGASPPSWSPGVWALTIAMWAAMMVAMMTPSAAPTVLLYARVHRHAQAGPQAAGLAPTWAFAAGYLLIWLGFSVAAGGVQWGLQRTGLVSAAMMGSQSRFLSAAVLAAAGLYQLSPLQNACLSHCRSPAAFLSRHWRPGASGAVHLGARHGLYCVGCCWILMALLFVGGVMNIAWIAILTLLVLAEKLVPGGPWIARATGAAMLAWAVATLLV